MHPHGVFYDKSSEGAPYNDGTHGAKKADDAVPTGGTHTYIWEVPERAGPGPDDGSSVMWMYHSHTDEVVRHLRRPDGADGDHRAGAWPGRTAARRTSTARSSRCSR